MPAPGRRRRCRGPGLPAGATALLALWATTNQFHAGHSFSSGIACPFESIVCVSNPDCSACIETLQAILASTELSLGTSMGCEGLYVDVCVIVEEAGCDPANEELIDLASCVAEDTFGCTEFTSCAEAVNATPAPAVSALTAAPLNTVEPIPATTVGPSAAPAAAVTATPDTSAPSLLDKATAVPTPSSSGGSRGGSGGLVTASPSSADGSRDLDLDTPSPSSTPVEPGEETSTDGGSGGWRSITAVTIVTRVSIVIAFFLAV